MERKGDNVGRLLREGWAAVQQARAMGEKVADGSGDGARILELKVDALVEGIERVERKLDAVLEALGWTDDGGQQGEGDGKWAVAASPRDAHHSEEALRLVEGALAEKDAGSSGSPVESRNVAAKRAATKAL